MAEAIANRPLPDEDIGGKDAEILRVARERYQKAIDADQQNRDDAVDDLRFLAGDQWPEEIRQERDEDGRPVLTINRMPQFVRQVTGDIRQNRRAIKARPADDVADDEVADLYSGLIRNIEYTSDAQIAYNHAGENAAQCGIGHFRIVTEYCGDDIFEQDIRIKRIRDPFSVTWDPHAIEPTRKDARYCFVEEEVDHETFRARYPDATRDGWDFQERSNPGYLGDWIKHKTVRIAEYWTREIEEREIAQLSDGRVIDVTDMQASRKKANLPLLEEGTPWENTGEEEITVGRMRKSYRDKVQMRIINGAEVLEGPFEWAGRWIPIVPVVGEEIYIEDSIVRHGVIRHAKDPQRLYNIWRSAQTEKIALEPKVPWTVTPTMIKGVEHIWQQANRRNLPYLPFTADKDAPGLAPKREAPQMGSAGMAQEVLVAADDMKATTGIYDAALGARSNETSGVAIRARQQESDVSTIVYADNLDFSLRHAGRILLDLIPKIYDSERVVRIMNEDETTESVTINQVVTDSDGATHKVNDLTIGKYDVVVSTGPSYSTKRQEAAEGMIEWARSDPEGASLIRDLIAKNLDWPGADEMAERFRKTLPPGLAEPREGEEPPKPAPPTPEQAAKMMEEQRKQGELQLKAREAQRKDAETAAKIADQQAETEGQRLENAQKAFELAMQDGTLTELIAQQVEAMLAQMFSGQAPPRQNGGMQ